MATLLLTVPRSVFKSSAQDLSPPISQIAIRRVPASTSTHWLTPPSYDSRQVNLPILIHLTWRG